MALARSERVVEQSRGAPWVSQEKKNIKHEVTYFVLVSLSLVLRSFSLKVRKKTAKRVKTENAMTILSFNCHFPCPPQQAEFAEDGQEAASFVFDVLVCASGSNCVLDGFDRRKLDAKVAIAITANFVNR